MRSTPRGRGPRPERPGDRLDVITQGQSSRRVHRQTGSDRKSCPTCVAYWDARGPIITRQIASLIDWQRPDSVLLATQRAARFLHGVHRRHYVYGLPLDAP